MLMLRNYAVYVFSYFLKFSHYQDSNPRPRLKIVPEKSYQKHGSSFRPLAHWGVSRRAVLIQEMKIKMFGL